MVGSNHHVVEHNNQARPHDPVKLPRCYNRTRRVRLEIDFVYRVIEGSALHTMIVKVDEVHEVMSVPSYDN